MRDSVNIKLDAPAKIPPELYTEQSPHAINLLKDKTGAPLSPYALVASGSMVSGIDKTIAGQRLENIREVMNPGRFSRTPSANCSVSFSTIAEGKLTASTRQFLHCIYAKFAENGGRSPSVRLSITEFQTMRGGISRKVAWEQCQRSSQALQGASVRYEEKTIKKAKIKKSEWISVFDRMAISNGVIEADFAPTFYEVIKQYPVRPYPRQVLSINGKINKYAVTLSDLIEEHRKITKKGHTDRRDVLTVQYLLTEAGFPDPESVNRHYKEKIIMPFEKNMDALTYLSWEYLDNNDRPIKKGGVIPWDVFKLARIRTKLNETPDAFKLIAEDYDIEGEGRVL